MYEEKVGEQQNAHRRKNKKPAEPRNMLLLVKVRLINKPQ